MTTIITEIYITLVSLLLFKGKDLEKLDQRPTTRKSRLKLKIGVLVS